jgi:hypothetical protein
MPRTFQLAPMDGLIRGLTAIIVGVGVVLVALSRGHGPLWLPGALVLVLSAAVYVVWRPSAFEVGDRALTLRFPVRSKTITLSGLASAQRLDRAGFRQRFGAALRVGVGGLFGGFGWLWTSKGWVEMDISRSDDLVLLEWRGRMPLLLTPVEADAFLAAVKAEAGLA